MNLIFMSIPYLFPRPLKYDRFEFHKQLCSVLIGLGIPSLCLGLWGFVNRKESLRGIRCPEWSRFNSGGMS